jgi:NADPH:quinone reductase-like Zn-dependent oxidoreductase
MKAIIWTAYGPPEVLQLREVEKPEPKGNEVLIKVHATSVTAGDCEMRSLKFPLFLSLPMRAFVGFRKPTRVTIIGQELAGEVVEVGPEVKKFKVGDQVFGSAGFTKGTYAEYVALQEESDEVVLAKKPSSMSFEEAATVSTGGLEALHFLGKANLQEGQKLLINGAGGSIGTYGIQLAKMYGAEVTAVDSAEKFDMMRSLGADHVIDYTQENFTKKGQIYDVIFDVVGKASFSGVMRSLTDEGIYLMANPRLSTMVRGSWATRRTSKTVVLEMTKQNTADLIHLGELIDSGVLKTVIDRRYPLEQLAEAHRYVETGRKQGNVVITVGIKSGADKI